MMKVVVSRKVPTVGIERLRSRGYQVDHHDRNERLSTEELLMRTRDADALWCLLDDPITSEFIRQCPNLKVIANYAVGFNNIDLDAARQYGIWVCNTPDVLTNATADLALALLLAVSRRIVEGHRYILENKFSGWESTLMLGSELSGKTIGILGAGRIGSAVAQRCLGFEMKVQYFNRSPKPELDRLGCKRMDLNSILSQSDFLSLHLPLTPETYHILSKERLSQVKPGAYVINTGRGALIDEESLVNSLQSGALSGAGLDVFEFEPEVSSGLLQLDNVVLLPHIGSATKEARGKMSEMCASSIIDVFAGKDPVYSIL